MARVAKFQVSFSFTCLYGCGPTPMDETEHWLPTLSNPIIQTLETECVHQSWTINVVTEGWTGNGLLWLSNGEQNERHPLYSISAAEDSSADYLRITLETVSDWRDWQSGSYTRFGCYDFFKIAIAIRHPETLQWSNCQIYQFNDIEEVWNTSEEDIEFWQAASLPDCFTTTSEND